MYTRYMYNTNISSVRQGVPPDSTEKLPMGTRSSPLQVKSLPESKPLKSRVLRSVFIISNRKTSN